MNIELQEISISTDKTVRHVSARGAKNDKGDFIITMMPGRITGSDIYQGMKMMKSTDDGKTWSPLTSCENLERHSYKNDWEILFHDPTPMYHKKSGVFLGIGRSNIYGRDDEFAPGPHEMFTMWSTYDVNRNIWSPARILDVPEQDGMFYRCGSGGSQYVELENGDILLPVQHASKETTVNNFYSDFCATVCRCSFDGNELTYLEKGNTLTLQVPRGFCEPSITAYKDEYFLCLRNDVSGYVTKSRDGLHYEEPVELCFDDGTNVGNYNTQQHWIKGGDRLYLVYTRRGADNDHIFRNRAPLFIAEFDPMRMCLIRSTEELVVPKRGADLGNFGCLSVNEREGYVFTVESMPGEWDQAAAYGSKGSLFIAKLHF